MKLLPFDLTGMLEFGGYIPHDVKKDPEAMCKICYLCDLINAHAAIPEPSLAASGISEAAVQDDNPQGLKDSA